MARYRLLDVYDSDSSFVFQGKELPGFNTLLNYCASFYLVGMYSSINMVVYLYNVIRRLALQQFARLVIDRQLFLLAIVLEPPGRRVALPDTVRFKDFSG